MKYGPQPCLVSQITNQSPFRYYAITGNYRYFVINTVLTRTNTHTHWTPLFFDIEQNFWQHYLRRTHLGLIYYKTIIQFKFPNYKPCVVTGESFLVKITNVSCCLLKNQSFGNEKGASIISQKTPISLSYLSFDQIIPNSLHHS